MSLLGRGPARTVVKISEPPPAGAEIPEALPTRPITVKVVDAVYEIDLSDQVWEASIRKDERRRIATRIHAARFDASKQHATPDTFYAGATAAEHIARGGTDA